MTACSCHDDYKYLTEGLLAWMRLLEIQGTRRLEAKLSLPSFFIDALALSIGTICFTAGGTRKEDFETAKMIKCDVIWSAQSVYYVLDLSLCL